MSGGSGQGQVRTTDGADAGTAQIEAFKERLQSGHVRQSEGDYESALGLYAHAEALAGNADDTAEALRLQVVILDRLGQSAKLAAALRRLRKLNKLKPNEHRRLIRALRLAGGSALIDRYVRVLGAGQARRGNWNRVALMLWAAGAGSELLTWGARHPDGSNVAARALFNSAANSLDHGERALALEIFRGVSAWGLDVALLMDFGDALRTAGLVEAAAEATGLALQARGSTDNPSPGEALDEANLRHRLQTDGPAAVLEAVMKGDAKPTDPRIAMLAAEAAQALGQGREALGFYRCAERHATDAARAGAALRAQCFLLTQHGEHLALAQALRRLRKREKLKPNEHRRLFRTLRLLGKDRLIDRYARLLRQAQPDSRSWPRIALVFWSTGYLIDLFSWAGRHPSGRGEAVRALQGYADNSAEHDEFDAAIAIEQQLDAWSAGDMKHAFRLADFYFQAGDYVEAIKTARLILSHRSDTEDTEDTANLMTAAAYKELARLADQVSPSNAGFAAESILLVEDVLGEAPLLRHIKSMVETWRPANESDDDLGSLVEPPSERLVTEIAQAAADGRPTDLITLIEDAAEIRNGGGAAALFVRKYRTLLENARERASEATRDRAAALLRLAPKWRNPQGREPVEPVQPTGRYSPAVPALPTEESAAEPGRTQRYSPTAPDAKTEEPAPATSRTHRYAPTAPETPAEDPAAEPGRTQRYSPTVPDARTEEPTPATSRTHRYAPTAPETPAEEPATEPGRTQRYSPIAPDTKTEEPTPATSRTHRYAPTAPETPAEDPAAEPGRTQRYSPTAPDAKTEEPAPATGRMRRYSPTLSETPAKEPAATPSHAPGYSRIEDVSDARAPTPERPRYSREEGPALPVRAAEDERRAKHYAQLAEELAAEAVRRAAGVDMRLRPAVRGAGASSRLDAAAAPAPPSMLGRGRYARTRIQGAAEEAAEPQGSDEQTPRRSRYRSRMDLFEPGSADGPGNPYRPFISPQPDAEGPFDTGASKARSIEVADVPAAPERPRWDQATELLEQFGETLASGPPQALAALRELTPFILDAGVRTQVEDGFVAILDALQAAPKEERELLADDLNRFAAEIPAVLSNLVDFYRAVGADGHLARFYLELPLRHLDGRGWMEAAKLALVSDDQEAATELCRRAVMRSGVKLAADVSALLLTEGLTEESIAIWSDVEDDRSRLRAPLGALRSIYAADQPPRLFDQALRVLQDASPFESLAPDDQNNLVSIVRLMNKCALETRSYAHFARLTERFADAQPESGLALWVDGMIKSSQLDAPAALACFEAALPLLTRSDKVALDLRGEIAVLHARHHRFGEAARAVEGIGTFPVAGQGYYNRLLDPVRRVSAFTPGQEHYPECLIDVIADEFAVPIGYQPEPNRVVTVTSSLAQGGSERQTVNIVRGLASDSRISTQTVLIRSITGTDGFFLPILQDRGVHLIVYGEDWRTPSDLDDALPMLADRPKLRKAIDLLPYSTREEVVRLAKLFLELRPAVVHLRQDLYAAGLACALVGVPKFFIHRGSLARNTWDHTPLQADVTLRPMRHSYRRLLERTPFFVVNNSGVGLQTDRDWIDWPDDSRFRVVHNAVDFDKLGEASGRNDALREDLGIPPQAQVVGGVFRIVPVKRPQLWIEIAGKILEQLPDAHFLIAGDGPLGDLMRAYAEQAGFADRLHLPGAVTNVGDWYRAMDVTLLTSDREGLPNANIEAQHFGIPVVSANVGGAAETLADGVTGFLVDPHAGADAFAERVVASLTDRAWRDAAVAQGPDFVHSRFGPSQAVNNVIRCYAF